MRHNFFGTILVVALFYTPQVKAQNAKTIEEQIPNDILFSPRDKILTMVVENDLLGFRGEDKNYTSGVRLTYFDVNADMPSIAYKLDDIIPTFEMNHTTSVFYSIGQNLYTPEDITRRTEDPNDRPWAGHLYGAIGLSTITDNHLDEIEFSLGIVGPSALGKGTQSFVHEHIFPDSPDPKGWDNQLNHEPTIGVGWVRRFPHAFNHSILDWSLAASPYFGLTLGNAHTFANAGFHARISPESEKWQDAPARVRPGLPGTGFFEIPEKKWSWYLFGGVESRAVARNIFLDGNTFSQSHHVDKKHFVYDLNGGVAITYDSFRISYTLVHRSKEFEEQDDPSVFGTISLGYRF